MSARVTFALLAAWLCALSSSAWSSRAWAKSPYELEPLPHALATGAALATVGLLQFAVVPSLEGGAACPPSEAFARCSPRQLNDFDRGVLAFDDRGWRYAGDGALAAVSVAGAALLWTDAIVSADDTFGDLWRDSLVVAEAIALERLLTYSLKFAVRRPRPAHYRERGPVGSFDHRLSFPSGHAGAAAVVGASIATTFFLRHPDSPWRWVVLSGAVVGAGFTGLARVFGGRHFYTDVIAGWILGAACGIAVPLLHRAPAGLSLAPVIESDAGGLSLSGRW